MLTQRATELHVGEPGQVRVALDPYLSVLALLTDALGRRRGAPGEWRQQVRAALRPAAAEAVQPILHPCFSITPDCVTPRSPGQEVPVSQQLAQLRELRDEELAQDLLSAFGEHPPPHWRGVLRQPRRWIHSYADAMADSWEAVRPLWHQARPLLEREVARVGTAMVRGQLGAVLDGLHPASRFTGGTLHIRDPEPGRFRLDGRTLILAPMLSGPEALICSLERPDAVWIGYPLPGAAGLRAARPPDRRAGGGVLGSLIGPVRAELLRATAQPLTMGELAARLGLPPSAITYHCERLAATGLIDRERRGREVRVTRTELASTLLDLC